MEDTDVRKGLALHDVRPRVLLASHPTKKGLILFWLVLVQGPDLWPYAPCPNSSPVRKAVVMSNLLMMQAIIVRKVRKTVEV